jgi:hypothetical protein
VTQRSVRWVQEHLRFRCPNCGASLPINKDRVALWLAEQERAGEAGGDKALLLGTPADPERA